MDLFSNSTYRGKGFGSLPEEEPMGCIGMNLVLLMGNGQMKSMWLPDVPDGNYRFADEKDGVVEEYTFLDVEAPRGYWVARCNGSACFCNVRPDERHETRLQNHQMLEIDKDGEMFILYAEAVDGENTIFHNYKVFDDLKITIGRDVDCDIYCPSRFISKLHAYLLRDEYGNWKIVDNGSTNGVYVNGQRRTDANLGLGDEIYIMGLRILIGLDFISVNDGNDRAIISERIKKRTTPRPGRLPTQLPPPRQENFFNRLPRKRQEIEHKVIPVEAPPMSMTKAQIPMLLRMGGSMVSSVNSLMMGHFTMLISSVLFPILSQKYTDKQRNDYEARRVQKYGEYLRNKAREIEAECRKEERELNEVYPALDTVLRYPEDGKRLWERRPVDDDFMSLRLGYGTLPMQAELDAPTRQFELDIDELEEQMFQLAEKNYTIQNVPIMHNFVKEDICGVLGGRRKELEFVRQLSMQLSLTHSYDEVKMIFLVNEAELKLFPFLRYLPHTWDDMQNTRFIATNTSEAYRIGEYLKDQLGEDFQKEKDLKVILKKRPYYMIFALDKKLYDSVEFLKDVVSEEQNHGVSVLAVFDDLPKECVKIFNLGSDGRNTVTSLLKNSGEDMQFTMDRYDQDAARRTMKTLANLRLKALSAAYSLPKTYTFLEMFNAGKVEHLNPLKRWRENNPSKTLSAPVGVATDGTVFNLDLHEKMQGPHGLVAGMTGSGKSEFIITYILSMAVNYHPDEVAFILIDYKGGGLAGAFEDEAQGLKLPHLVGTITNLDGGAIQRSLMSIQSELMRRQRVFNQAKSSTGEGTMNIYTYQKLYRAKKVSEPMPHLFIISDEFAELKQQQPEFMAQLISAARIGRSLGVHLILATQKPAGVVNDQIRSNTKFRVCLRVQDRADSMDMLKRPEAAELKDTGRFYLQVGYNEFFALGQSAWCGADYEPQNEVVVQRDDSIQLLDITGQAVLQDKPKIEKARSDMKQIVAVVKYLSEMAKRDGFVPKKLWTEPLPDVLTLDEMYRRYPKEKSDSIQVQMGIMDDPMNQDQYPLVMNLQKLQNLLVVGESGCGKSTFLQTMLYNAAHDYSPEEVNFYILDFSSKLLNVFKEAPHCGVYLTDEDEDALDRFFKFITEMIETRTKLFDEAKVNDYDAYLERHKLPLALVVIDGYAGFVGTKVGNTLNTRMHEFMRKGVSRGIKFIFAGSFMNEFVSKVKQEAGDRIALQAKDKYAYAEILGQKVTNLSKENKGRGLVGHDEGVLEYQAAILEHCESTQERNARIQARIDELSRRYAHCNPALSLPVLTESETYEQFVGRFPTGRIPLGYSIQNVKPVAIPLQQLFCMPLYFGNPSGVAPVLGNLIAGAKREGARFIVVKKLENSLFGREIPVDSSMEVIDCTQANSVALWQRLAQEIQKRKVFRNEYCTQHGLEPTDPKTMVKAAPYIRENTRPLFVIFERFYDFCIEADPSCKEVMPTIFQGGAGYNFYFLNCYYPDDADRISSNVMHTAFLSGRTGLFFGGQFSRQSLITLPREYQIISNVSKNYNRGIMYYRDQAYTIQMPCGPLEEPVTDADMESIF